MIGGGTAASVSAAAPLASSLPVELSAADRARVDQALRDSRAANTRAQYRSAWRGWAEWSALNGHATLPADPLAIAACLAERVAAAATVRTIRAAIRAGHVDTGADDPTGHESLACDDDADEEAPRRARHRGGSSAIDGPVHDGGLTTADQRQANSRAYLRAAARLTAKRERWQADRARAAPGEAKRARRRVRRVVRRAA